ncbi:hypothetical protein AVEN_134445-1 [Araneus ventricosus]|uniref:Uncharacterized protein n=1 Tax=Araneus ventricosus TaxID=182803 RepID=A0A4Y2K1I1_ARAVE|nr:hypothetical protein AVEN_134445-1 [Araneus ventricosus]
MLVKVPLRIQEDAIINSSLGFGTMILCSRATKVDFFLSLMARKEACQGMYPLKVRGYLLVVVKGRNFASRDWVSGRPCGFSGRRDLVFGMAVAHPYHAAKLSCSLAATTSELLQMGLLQGQLGRMPGGAFCDSNHCVCNISGVKLETHWKTEWKSVVFSDESQFCLGATVFSVLVRKGRPGERNQPVCRPRPRWTYLSCILQNVHMEHSHGYPKHP